MIKSEEALEKMYYGVGSEKENNETYMIIYRDLVRLKKLEEENEILKKAIENSNKAYDVLMQNSNIQFLSQNQENEKLKQENEKLKQALDKACEKLDYTCPVEEELIEDLDCDNCDSNCKECWKKYFLKEVFGNEKL